MKKLIHIIIDRIEPEGLRDLAIAIFPGLIIVSIIREPYALLISFFTVCGVIPFRQHGHRWLLLLHVNVIFLFSLLFVFVFKNHMINSLILLLFSLLLGYLDTHLKALKILSSWFFIGLLYGDAEMRTDIASISPHSLLIIYAGILLSCLIFFLLLKNFRKIELSWQQYKFSLVDSIEYSRYFIFFIVAMTVWLSFDMSQPQWLLWSGLSVLTFDLLVAKKKIKDRLTAGSIGVLFGFGYMIIFPSNRYTIALAYIGILLSLRAFKRYKDGFGLRCFCITVFSGSSYLVIGEARLFNILIGGLIGITTAFVLSQIDLHIKKRFAKP